MCRFFFRTYWGNSKHLNKQQQESQPFMTEKAMDWFLYDNGLRHEIVKSSFEIQSYM